MAKSFMSKVKDVATLKTLRENFFKNDGSISQWFAHGATEAANMVLHGHAAPVYAGNVSPPDQMSTEFQPSVLEPMQAFSPQQEPEQKKSFLQAKMQDIEQQPEMQEPEMEYEH
jgi:hypothetical protein